MAIEELKLRPHHVLCYRFQTWDYPERSEAFRSFEEDLRRILNSDDNMVIEIVEGVDELCSLCLNCRNGRCESPEGNEEMVRKWDGIILKGLGLSYGNKETSRTIRTIVDEKAPLALCTTKCPYQQTCNVLQLSSL